jgi:hypothetical protein
MKITPRGRPMARTLPIPPVYLAMKQPDYPFDKEALATGELRPMLFGVGRQPVMVGSPDGKAMGFHLPTQ